MPRKNKHRSRKSDKNESFLFANEERKHQFSALKSIDKFVSKTQFSERRKELQLQRKAKRKINKLRARESTRVLRRVPSKISVLQRDSFLSGISDELETGHGQLLTLRSKDNIMEESEINKLEKLLDDREKIYEEEQGEEEAEFGSDRESDDSYVEDREATMERIRRTFKKSNLYQKSDTLNANFFEALGGIPSIENISLDLSGSDLDLAYGWKKPEDDSAGLDVGHFVDPLTGASLQSSTVTPVESIMIMQPELMPEASVILDEQVSEGGLMGVEFRDEVDEELDKVSEKDEDRDFTMGDIDDLGKWFGVTSKHKGLSEDKFDYTKTDYFVRHMIPFVYEFVNQLINKVVERAHYAEPAMLLRQNFNKKKIMEDLEAKMRELEDERQFNMLLNKKIVEYYRRKKDFRALTEDSPEKIMPLIEEFNENMEKLTTLSSQEEDYRHLTSIKISNLNEILQQEEKFSRQSVDNLEKLFRKTLVRDRFETMNDLVTSSVKNMASTREEISKQRFMLIRKLHTLAKLKEKEDKLEDLGNGLTMHSFEHLQADTTNLGQKNDERAQDLNRLHIKRNKFLHIIANMRERHKMLRNTLEVKEGALNDLLEERRYSREWLTYQKISRKNTRYEFDSLLQQSGLTGNTALMLDYDETATQLKEAKTKVKQLKSKYDQLQKRFSKLEIRYSRVGDL